jgi:hypothetical protein
MYIQLQVLLTLELDRYKYLTCPMSGRSMIQDFCATVGLSWKPITWFHDALINTKSSNISLFGNCGMVPSQKFCCNLN